VPIILIEMVLGLPTRLPANFDGEKLLAGYIATVFFPESAFPNVRKRA
jgi:hypothetical protein